MCNPLSKKLADEYGFDSVFEMLESAVIDSVAPGICVECEEYTCDVEPDSNSGWCENCKDTTVWSCLILEGIM